jgi:hypothetical protein
MALPRNPLAPVTRMRFATPTAGGTRGRRSLALSNLDPAAAREGAGKSLVYPYHCGF